MIASSLDLKRSVLETRYANLSEQYTAANAQLDRTLSASDRLRIQDECRYLFQQLTEVEQELQKLQELNSPEIDYNTRYKIWQENLPKINFSDLDKILNSIFNEVSPEQGKAVFFLLQNCHPMGGEWCVEKIKASLKDNGVWSPREVGFQAWEQPNEADFLRRLGASLGVEVIANTLEYTREIIAKIYDSLQMGSTVFIELRIVSLENQNIFVDRLINNFWIPLISGLPEISRKLPFVKFVIVMTIENSIPTDCLSPSLFCEKGNFNSQKIIEIELCKWTEIEIRNWLYRFSGLAAPHVGRNKEEIDQMARTFYQVSQEGRPRDVHSLLMKELTRAFS